MAQWMKDLPYKHEDADLQHSSKNLGTGTCDPHNAGVAETREDSWSPLASQPR